MNKENVILIDDPEVLIGISDRLDTIIEIIKSKDNQQGSGFDNLLTNADVQRILKVSSSKLQALRSRGQISFIKRGKTVYYTHEHIQEFLEEDNSTNFQTIKDYNHDNK